jgi:hypothetical protein
MAASSQNIERTPLLATPIATSNAINKGRYVLIALSIITLIGSLVAAGCLYSQLGHASFAIGAAGVVLALLCFLLSKYCCAEEDIIDTLTRSVQREDDAYLIDFSQVNPSNILKIFKDSHLSNVYGDVTISDKISYDESSKFKHNFPFKYHINIVTIEKNEHGYNSSQGRSFTMNREGKVESYGKVFDNFDLYLEHLMKDRIYEGKWCTFEHFDFPVQAQNGQCKKLRKKAST